jgi:hypothetical protein
MKTILAATVAIALMATPSHAVQIKLKGLHEQCSSKDPFAHMSCFSYILGVTNGVEMGDLLGQLPASERWKGRVNDPPYRLVCVPDAVEPQKLVDQVIAAMDIEIKHYPKTVDLPGYAFVVVTLAHLYPCQGGR